MAPRPTSTSKRLASKKERPKSAFRRRIVDPSFAFVNRVATRLAATLIGRNFIKAVKHLRRNYYWWFIVAFAVVVAIVYRNWRADRLVPYTDRLTKVELPRSEELILADRVIGDLFKSYGAVRLGSHNRAGRLFRRFAQAEIPFSWNWKLYQIDSAAEDIMGLPGGSVIITSRMTERFIDEDLLGASIAHVMGHALALHGSERITSSGLTQLGDLIKEGAPVRFNQEIVWALAAAFGADQILEKPQPYTIEQELEADQIGIHIMANACFDPTAMITFWETLKKYDPKQEDPNDPTPQFVKSHVTAESRTLRLSEFMNEAMQIKLEKCISNKLIK